MQYAKIDWSQGLPYNSSYNDIYYSNDGAKEEARHVFINGNSLNDRFSSCAQFTIAEIGFGFGLNFVLTLKTWEDISGPESRLHYIAIEKHPVSPDDISCLASLFPGLAVYFKQLLAVYPEPVQGHHVRYLSNNRVCLHIIYMDVEDALADENYLVDAWYLDGFSPQQNKTIWNERVFHCVSQNSRVSATLATYSSAGFVRRGLESAGFKIIKVPGFHNKREMIVGELVTKSVRRSDSPWYDISGVNASTTNSVTVIGAGIAGLSVAWSLINRGYQVTLIDQHKKVAQEASGNPASLLFPRLSIDNPLDMQFYLNAFLYAVTMLDQLQDNSEIDFWFKKGAYSLLGDNRGKRIVESNDLSSVISLIETDRIPKELLHYKGDILYSSKAGWVRSDQLCSAIYGFCEKNIDRVIGDAHKISRNQDIWEVSNKEGIVINRSEVLVLAMGCHINNTEIMSWLPVNTVRGQVTKLSESDVSRDMDYALSFDGYLTPAYSGVHYTGASYQVDDVNENLTDIDHQLNLSRLDRVLPSFFALPDNVDGRVGFRAVSEDRVPVVGRVPDYAGFIEQYHDLSLGKPVDQYLPGKYLPGLYVTAAHGSRGFTSSFLSAEIIACMIAVEEMPVSKKVLDYLNPSRFIIRSLKRNQPRY